MRKLITVSLLALCLFGVGYFFASPYVTLYKIHHAVASKDIDTLSAFVDYPSLRTSLKPVVMRHAKQVTEKQDSDGAVVAFGKTLGNVFFKEQMVEAQSAIVEKSLDQLVSPDGLLRLMSGNAVLKNPDGTTQVLTSSPVDNLDSIRTNYKGLDTFHVSFDIHPSSSATVILTRVKWVNWKITAVQFYPSPLEPTS